MRTPLVCSALVGAVLLGTIRAAVAAEPSIDWAKSYPAAIAIAKQTHKLVMADMYTDWCGVCKQMDKDTYTDKGVIRLTEQVVPVKINAEKEGLAVAKRYDTITFPTLLFINGEGELQGKIVGYLSPDNFAQELKRVLEAHQNFPALQARLQKNPNDLDAMVKLEEIYALRSDEKQVADLLARVEKRDPKNVQGYLAGAYNCMGDLYQSSLKFEEAVSYFQKALTVGKKPADIAHAHFNIAVCYINLDPPRYKEAAAEFKAVASLPDAPADLKKDAQDAVKQLKANNIQ